jgi:GNAT superfamily N-acetyltransferase
VILREASRPDLPSIVALIHQDMIRDGDETHVPAEAYGAAFDEITADDRQQLLVGEVDGEVVATAQVTWVRQLAYVGGLMCQVESVRVRPDLRGRGLGRMLMEHVIGLARDRGAVRVELTTNARRTRAQEFYKGLGFVASHVGMKLYLGGSHA